MLDYIYSEQASQYAYYRIPKILFTDDRYRDISTDAKVLYGLLLDRVSLSIKNKWVDDQNRVFIIFSLADVQESLNCGPQKATALFRELEKKAGLIERKRQGLGKPNLIYVKNFCEAPRKSLVQNHENHPYSFILIHFSTIFMAKLLHFSIHLSTQKLHFCTHTTGAGVRNMKNRLNRRDSGGSVTIPHLKLLEASFVTLQNQFWRYCKHPPYAESDICAPQCPAYQRQPSTELPGVRFAVHLTCS